MARPIPAGSDGILPEPQVNLTELADTQSASVELDGFLAESSGRWTAPPRNEAA
jgi:hypothetical protein